LSRISAPRSRDIFGHVHDLILQPYEHVSNKSYDLPNPANLVQPALRAHPFQPPLPAYPAALVRDARLVAPPKDRSLMLMTDAAMQRLWLRETRERAEVGYIANWHREVREDRAAFELAWVVNEVLRRQHFFLEVFKLLQKRISGQTKARHLQQIIFKQIREHGRKSGIVLHEHTLRRIKAGLEMRAKSLAWRLDNLYLETDTHSLVKVKHGGHHVESVIGDIMWQLRAKMTHNHHEWRLDNLFLPNDIHGFVRVKHSGQPLEAVTGALSRQARSEITKRHAIWRLDHLYITLPNGGITQVHHVPGQQLERITAKVQWPKEELRHNLARTWHEEKSLIITPNGGMVHSEGMGQMPEAAAAALFLPLIKRRQKDALENHASRQLLTVPNGGFVHSDRGHPRGESPELVTAQVNHPKQDKTLKGHREWRQNNLAAPTPNHGFAPLKGHGKSPEHVAAVAADAPKHRKIDAFKQWRATHVFATSANHQLLPVKIRGASYAKVSGDVAGHYRDLVTKHFLERRQARDQVTKNFREARAANLYVQTANGGWRRLEHSGKSLELVEAQVAPPDEGTDGLPVIQAKAGQETGPAKLIKGEEMRRARRHDFSAIQKSLAAHEVTVSQLQGHIVHEAPPIGATNSGTLQKIVAYAPTKKVGG